MLSLLGSNQLLLVIVAQLLVTAPVLGALVTEESAQQLGLDRAWRAQAEIDTSRYSVIGAQLSDDALYVVSSAGLVQAIDAESGRTLWRTRLGTPGQPTLGPSWRDGRIAVINGTTLYLLDAKNGQVLHQRKLTGAPAAAPALAEKYCFVPMYNGRLLGYPLDADKSIIWRHASGKHVFDPPTIINDRVIWTTSGGELYAASAESGGVDYRFKTSGRLIAPAVSIEETIFIASTDGRVYALDAKRGKQLWRASVGASVVKPVSAVAGAVYLVTEEPALYALDASSGEELWVSEGVTNFVARSADRVYAVGQTGELIVFDAVSGSVLTSWQTSSDLTAVPNVRTDRLYFVTPNGLVQCLHEESLDTPLLHIAQTEADRQADKPENDGLEQPVAAVEAADPVEEEPAFQPEPEPTDEEDPFGSDFGF
jgi:outer membrane protein assembly factor BamB